MKAKRGEIERAVAAPGAYRLFLLHGADVAGSNALAAKLSAALGTDVERVSLTPSALKADPALLGDEAASMSLFGGKRLILVEGGGITVSRFLAQGLLDRLQIAIAPVIIGSGRQGLQLPEVLALSDCLRPPCRHHQMGPDVLWDLDLAATG